MGLSGVVPKSQMLRWVIWELPSRGQYKLNFGGSFRDNKVGARFVIQNDIGTLVETGSFHIIVLPVPETKIRGWWDALVWASVMIPGQRIVLEGDGASLPLSQVPVVVGAIHFSRCPAFGFFICTGSSSTYLEGRICMLILWQARVSFLHQNLCGRKTFLNNLLILRWGMSSGVSTKNYSS